MNMATPSRRLRLAAAMFCIGASLAIAEPPELPSPFQGVTADYRQLSNLLTVVKVEHFPSGEFRTVNPPRIVKEDTIQWTFKSKIDLTGPQVYRLLHNPYPQIVFWRRGDDGTEQPVFLRPNGYPLICDSRWFTLSSGPRLKQGDLLTAVVHLGDSGSEQLLNKQVERMSIEFGPLWKWKIPKPVKK